jgi:hypothetical protein
MDLDDEPEDLEIDLGAQWLRKPKGGSNGNTGNSSRGRKSSGETDNKTVSRGERKKPRPASKGGPK